MVEDMEDRAGQLIAETALGRDMVEREIPHAEPEPRLVAHGAAECRHIGNAVLPVGVGGDNTVILAAARQLLKIAQAGFQRITLAAVLLMAQHRAAGDLRRQRKNRGVVRAAAVIDDNKLPELRIGERLQIINQLGARRERRNENHCFHQLSPILAVWGRVHPRTS